MFINRTICFQGIGIALLVSQALIGIYSIVGVSWMFIYFRDSFITKQDSYQWAEPYDPYRDGKENVMVSWVISSTWGFLGDIIAMLNVAHLLYWSVITIQEGIALQIIHNSHFLLWNHQPPKCCFSGPNN